MADIPIGFNELDRRIGASEGYTSRMLSERRWPRLDMAIRLARALNKSVGHLVGEEP
jgi:hypothetical protein